MKIKKMILLSVIVSLMVMFLPYNEVVVGAVIPTEHITLCDFESLTTQTDIESIFENVETDLYDGGNILDIVSNNCYSGTRALYIRSDYAPTEDFTKAYMNLTNSYDYIKYINMTMYLKEVGGNSNYRRDIYLNIMNNGQFQIRIWFDRSTDAIFYHSGSSWLLMGDYGAVSPANKLDGYYNINITHVTGDQFNYTIRNHTGVLKNFTVDSSPSSGWNTFDQIHIDGKENQFAGGADYNELYLDKIEIGGMVESGGDYPYIGWIQPNDANANNEHQHTWNVSSIYNCSEWRYNKKVTWMVKKIEIPIHETLYNTFGLSSSDYHLSINGNDLGNPDEFKTNEFGITVGMRKHLFIWDDINVMITDDYPLIELNIRGDYMAIACGPYLYDVDNDSDSHFAVHKLNYGVMDGELNGFTQYNYEPQYKLYYQEFESIMYDSITLYGDVNGEIEQYSSLGISYTVNTSSSLDSYINVSRAGFSLKTDQRGFTTWVITNNETGNYYVTLNRGGVELVNESIVVLSRSIGANIWFDPRIIEPGEPTYLWYIFNVTAEGGSGIINLFYPNSNRTAETFVVNQTDNNMYRLLITKDKTVRIGEYVAYLYVEKGGKLIRKDTDSFYVLSDELSLRDPWIELEDDKESYISGENVVIIGNHYFNGKTQLLELKEGENTLDTIILSHDENIREVFNINKLGTYKVYLLIDNEAVDSVEFNIVDVREGETDYNVLIGVAVVLGIGGALAFLIDPLMFPFGSGAMAYLLSSPEMGRYAMFSPELGYGLIAILALIALLIWLTK